LFILVLAVFQCGVALIGGLVAHLVTNVPRWRRLRGRAVRAALFAAMGSFVGGLAGYAIVAAGIGTEIAAPLMGGLYLTGFAWAGRNGWLRGDLAPDFERDPIR
jgi:hypothetical protein